MFEISLIDSNYDELYGYFKSVALPFCFDMDFAAWEKSMFDDNDGEGRRYFKWLKTVGAYQNGRLVGFSQYGISAFGFSDSGEISDKISYSVIRALYFNEDCAEAGEMLLQAALKEFGNQRVYSFFHYFGMTVCGRHGKLPEKYTYIERLLKENGFSVEHENVYYSKRQLTISDEKIELRPKEKTSGNQQALDFYIDGSRIGECELHFVNSHEAYLRWIGIDGSRTNCGLGAKAMKALCSWLCGMGYDRLDTDTAVNNHRARHFYEKTGFECLGVTRSYLKE